MNTITRKKGRSTNKTPEIARFIQLMNALNLKAADIASKTKISERTITNFLWNDRPLGAQLLRELHSRYGVSIDWLLSGSGSMLLDQVSEPQAHYHATQTRDPRVQGMYDLIQELMDSASSEEQVWLEMHFKFSMNQYKQMLSTSNTE